MRKKLFGMKDLAEFFGVSTSTISRALNPLQQHLISSDLVTKIKEKAKEVNFTINPHASSLKSSKTKMIGVVIADILNPIFPPIIKGIQSRLKQEGYIAIIVFCDNNQDEALSEIKKLIAQQVDGLILTSAFIKDKGVIEALKAEVPLVLLSRTIEDSHLVDNVLNDEDYGMQLGIGHLDSLGHKEIAHFSGPNNVSPSIERRQSFVRICKEKGIIGHIYECKKLSINSGIRAAREFISSNSKATAIFAGNDLIALGIMKYFQRKGVKVPEDVSVMGINNMLFSDAFSPALTTVEIPYQDLGTYSASLILSSLENPTKIKKRVLLSPRLILRKSVAPPAVMSN